MARGTILYRGPSVLDSKPIMAVASGLKGGESRNSKTGPIVQVWFIRADMSPMDAALAGEDGSVCGSCKHRGIPPKRSCYVRLEWAPGNVYRAAVGGSYSEEGVAALEGLVVRLGAYGDPTAVPLPVIRSIVDTAKHSISYTHEWDRFPEFRKYCMASVENESEYQRATEMGWRTFRIRHPGSPARLKNEILCPATNKKGVTCQTCLLCVPGRAKKNIVMPLHGGPEMKATFYERLYGPPPKQMELFDETGSR